MKNLLTVQEMSEKLNRSTATIYKYLKDGVLTGFKKDGIWLINADADNEEAELTEQTSVDNSTNQNSLIDFDVSRDTYTYLDVLKEKLEKCDKLEHKVIEKLKEEVEISKEMRQLRSPNPNKKLPKFPMDIEQAKLTCEYYKTVSSKRDEIANEIDVVCKNYKFIEGLCNLISKEFIVVKHSKKTESVYLKIARQYFPKFLNVMAMKNKKVFVLNHNMFDEDSISIRFSSHLVPFTSNYRDYIPQDWKGVDVLAAFDDFEEDFDTSHYGLMPKNDEEKLKKILTKKERAKKYSKNKLGDLSRDELEDYYNLTFDITANKYTKKTGFAERLLDIQGVLKELIGEQDEYDVEEKKKLAHRYNTTSLKKLTKEQVQELYDLTFQLEENIRTKNSGLTKHLLYRRPHIKSYLEKLEKRQ